MRNAALAIDYLHNLRHGWDPLSIEFHHATLFGNPDTPEVKGDMAERSSILRRSAHPRSKLAS